MKRIRIILALFSAAIFAVLAAGCNPGGTIPGAPEINTDKTSLAYIADNTGRSEKQMAADFAIISMMAADRKYGDVPTQENAVINFDEYSISRNQDKYWLWGTITKSGDNCTLNLVVALENAAVSEQYVFRMTGRINIRSLIANTEIAGNEYNLNISTGRYY